MILTNQKKQSKAQRIQELERKLREVEAAQIHRHHVADAAISKASTDKLLGSGVIITLTLLGGQEVFEPLLIRNGLSNDTIEYLRDDIRSSFEYATELKPNGVAK